MEFYKVKHDTITLTKNIGHKDIVFILDGTAGYIFKGKNAIDLDELAAKKIDLIIKETFNELSFVLIPDLIIKDNDNPKLIQVKREISKRLPKEISDKLNESRENLISKIKQKISEFKTYENSMEWRKKLSNLTNLWKLAIFNIVVIAFCIIFIFNQSLFHLSIGDYFLLLALILLLSIFVINIIFVIFPMKFPVKILELGGESKTEALAQKFPPKPKIPELTVSEEKVMSKSGKPIAKQMELAPLKPKIEAIMSDKKVIVEGGEYSNEEELALGIPKIPDAPNKIKKITLDSPGLSTDILEKIKNLENSNSEVVLVNCERCKSIIPVPVPKKAISNSKLPVVPISYVHKNLKDKDEHCITLHIDHDFDIRRQRISDVVLSN